MYQGAGVWRAVGVAGVVEVAAAGGLTGVAGVEWALGEACCIVIELQLCRGVLLAGGVAAGVVGVLLGG